MVDNKKPYPGLTSLLQILGHILNHSLFNLIQLTSITGVNQQMQTLTQERRWHRNDLTHKANQFLNLFVNDFLISRLGLKNKLINVTEVLQLIKDDPEIGGEGVLQRGEDFYLGLFDGLLVDGDGEGLLFALYDLQDEVKF